MLATTIAFLVMLNPFALFVILEPVRRDMDNSKRFLTMLFKASMNSALLFVTFFLAGDFILTRVFQINFDAFRIFGGIIIFAFAYLYIIRNRKALIRPRKDIDDLALDVSVPFMVGAGTISLSILLARVTSILVGILLIAGILAVNYFVVVCLMQLRGLLTPRREEQYDKYMSLAMRINIFLVGAIGVDMIVTGVANLF